MTVKKVGDGSHVAAGPDSYNEGSAVTEPQARFRITGDAYDRVQIRGDGVATGDGTAAPTVGTFEALANLPLNAKDAVFGAKGDGQRASGGLSINSGQAILASTTPRWTAADVGKIMVVDGAGAGGISLATTIASWQSTTQVTLAANAATTVADQSGYWATDDTAALIAWVAAVGVEAAGTLPNGIYGLSSPLVFPRSSMPATRTFLSNGALLLSTVQNNPAVDMDEGVVILGRLAVYCGNAAGSICVRFQGSAGCRNARIQQLDAFAAAAADVQFRDINNNGVYYNQIDYLHARRGNGIGVEYVTRDGVAQCNANKIGYASIQNQGGDAVKVTNSDGNQIAYLEAESNTGWGFNFVSGRSFTILDGFIEGNTAGNVQIANNPTVNGYVGIRAQFDGGTISHTYSGSRYVSIENTQSAAQVGTGKVRVDVFGAGSATWTKPVWAAVCDMHVIGAGGGGGSGRRGAAGTVRCGGGGGAGGSYSFAQVNAVDLSSTHNVTVAAGGAGGAAVTANDTDGNPGGNAGSSFVGTATSSAIIGTTGGLGGGGGTAAAGAGGSNGSGTFNSTGGASASATGGVGGSGSFSAGPGAGGAGGGITAADSPSAGGSGSRSFSRQQLTVPAGGAINTAGTAATNATPNSPIPGSGGGGGGGSIVGAGGAGGAGITGGGGGGGGASLNGNNSGAGGAGGDGLIVIVSRGG